MSTGVVKPGSDLERRAWMREGMVQAASKSFWNAFTGNSADAIVFQAKDESAKDGHTVVFDYDGNITGKAVRGKQKAAGTGELKRKFSDKITVERYRMVVNNGDKFDGVNIGDLKINEHSDSREKLADAFVRFKDQAIFDAAQGNLLTLNDGVQDATHAIKLTSAMTYDDLIEIERTLKTSQGYNGGTFATIAGGMRRPPKPFNLNEREPVWLMVIDSFIASQLRLDKRYQQLVSQADPRGMDNRVFTGTVKRMGALAIVEAPTFFGSTKDSHVGDEITTNPSGKGWYMNDSETEISGLRLFQAQADGTVNGWSGQNGFSFTPAAGVTTYSRCLILGAGGVQIGFGKQPDYKVQYSEDFAIDSESCLEVWMETRKSKLHREAGSDYHQAKIGGIDYGVIALDVPVNLGFTQHAPE